jgi:prefoldin subunit 5
MPETESKPEDFEVKIKELVDSKFQLQKNVTEELDRKITQLKDTVDAAGNNVRDFNQFYKDNFNAEKDGISNINIFKQNLATLSTLEAELQETKEKIKKLDEESADIVVKIKASKVCASDCTKSGALFN